MYKKVCGKCKQPSFSSSEMGTWICPVCENDLTNIKHQRSEKIRNIRPFRPVEFSKKEIVDSRFNLTV